MNFFGGIILSVVLVTGNANIESILNVNMIRRKDEEPVSPPMSRNVSRHRRYASYAANQQSQMQPQSQSLPQSVIQPPTIQQQPCGNCYYGSQPCRNCYRQDENPPIFRHFDKPATPTPVTTLSPYLQGFNAFQPFASQIYPPMMPPMMMVIGPGGTPVMVPVGPYPFMTMMPGGMPQPIMSPISTPMMMPGGMGWPMMSGYQSATDDDKQDSFGISFELGGVKGDPPEASNASVGDILKSVSHIISAGRFGKTPD